MCPFLFNNNTKHLLELGPAAAHDLSLADKLCTELTTIEGEVDVKVDSVEGTLGGIHALKVGLKVLAREVGREGDDFLDAWFMLVIQSDTQGRGGGSLTRILCVFRADILVASVQDVLVHKGRSRRHLSEEADLDRLADLDTFALLHKDLSGVLASIPTIQAGHTVLFRVVALFEWLESSHEVVPTCDTVGDDSFCDSCGDSSLDDRCDGVHGSDNLRLVLRRHVEFNLLEQVLGGTESTNHKHVLRRLAPTAERERERKKLT